MGESSEDLMNRVVGEPMVFSKDRCFFFRWNAIKLLNFGGLVFFFCLIGISI